MKRIPISGKNGIGKYTLVDDEDYEKNCKWHLKRKKDYRFFGYRLIDWIHHPIRLFMQVIYSGVPDGGSWKWYQIGKYRKDLILKTQSR